MKKVLPFLTLLYPIIIYGLRDSAYFKIAALSLGGILIVDIVLRFPIARRYRLTAVCALLGAALALILVGVENIVRLYPFMMSGSMLTLFAVTKDPGDNPMIGPFRKYLATDPKMLVHLHRAKTIWIVGLSINTLILGIFLFAFPLQSWILYASFYSYILLASLFILSIAYVALARRNLL
ncbi:MAG: hypothetical protein H7249_05540 [Chitinophagaceae bacterium]|nr:hypothetical protein [Oligoflexus sp.]